MAATAFHKRLSNMRAPGPVTYLPRAQINTLLWDACVQSAPNGWLYAHTFYLDALGEWDGLIMDNYAFVMPLPRRTKYGLRYIYIPPFTGQLGIIGKGVISSDLVNAFINAIPPAFILADLLMNEGNAVCTLKKIQSTKRINYILSLAGDYDSIRKAYTSNARKNIIQAQSAGLIPRFGVNIEQIVEFHREAYAKRSRQYTADAYDRFRVLAGHCLENGLGLTIGIENSNHDLVAAAFFGQDSKRVYYILGAPTPEGRKLRAFHCIIDEVIKRFSGSSIIFDFEGSNIASVAQFYRKFRPVPAHYELLRVRQVASWIRQQASGVSPWQRKKVRLSEP